MSAPVRIYQIDRAFSEWVWLCSPHLERRLALNYQVKASKDPPHDGLPCLDCHFDEPTTIPGKGDAT